MAEEKGIPIIMHGKENKFQGAFKLEEIVCEDKQLVKNELKILRSENLNSATHENQNLFGKPCKSINCFQNYVGKLNEVCLRRSTRSPDYNEYVTENGEFIIQCKMFDNSVTQGRSRSKKDAKHKAAKAMLQILNDREESRCQQFSAFKESVEHLSIPIIKVTENVNVILSSSTTSLTNHVGKLNERIKNYQQHPTYRFCGTENGEFVIECKLCDNTITRGQSKSKKDAKQKAAEAMLLVLNSREESMCSNHLEFIKPTLKPFENHVGIINEISNTPQIKQSSDEAYKTVQWEFINRCKIIDNTLEQPKFKIDSVKEVLGTLNDNEDSRKDKEESQGQRYVDIMKHSKNLTKSTLSSKENINIKLSSSVKPVQIHVGKFNKTIKSDRDLLYQVSETENGKLVTECTIVEQPKFQKVERPKSSVLNNSEKSKYDKEELKKNPSMNDEENLTYQNDMQRHINLTDNGSIRLSAPTDPSNEIYYKSMKKYLSKRVCKTDHREKYKIFENAQYPTPKADKAIDKWKNDGKASTYISNKLIVKSIPDSTLNVTANENFRLSSEQFENLTETREETYYKNKKKHFSHRVCRKLYNGESRYQKHAKVTERAKNLTNPTLSATGNVSDELRSSAEQFESHIGKLNKTFYKNKKHFLPKTCCRIENDELATECNIFKNTVAQQSTIKNDLKPKASDVLLDLLSDSEASRIDREESIYLKHMEFYKCAKNFPISSLNVRKNGRSRIHSRVETFENYVKKLNEEYGKKIKQRPGYRGGETKNGEYIIECIINNTITRGQSRYKKEAKQKAAKEMLKTLAESRKMKKQESMESLEEYKLRRNQGKLLVGLDTDIVVERNDVLSASPNKSSTLIRNTCRSSVQFENYVGILNEICFKETLKHPLYTTFKIDSGEFITKCEMFDKTCSHGRSTTKKEAKQKAAKAMVQMISKTWWNYQRQQETKSFQIGKFSEFISNVTEKKIVCSQADMASSSTEENDNLEPFIDSFENHVGELNDFCSKRRFKVPTYIEHLSEISQFTCECKVINDTVETVTCGRSMLRKDAKQKAAQKMFKILMESSKLEHRSLMTSVTIMDTTDYSQQMSMEELNNQIAVKQSDWSSLEYMNEQELEFELKDLNISYKITAVQRTTNALRLKTKPTKDFKSLTFISTGESRLKISLNLLRKAVFGLRILKK